MWITFLSDELKLIREEMAYPFWSFGAEVGSYIGMFLGISFMQVGVDLHRYIFNCNNLWQVPDMIEVSLKFLSNSMTKMKKICHKIDSPNK